MNIHCKYDELMPVHKLKPHPKNRNKHPEDQIERLAKILKYQGVRAPIVVSRRSNKIVKGHGTLQAIKANQWDKAPVVYQDFEDDDQEWLFVQSDNAIASWAELDLKGINADIGELGPFDIDLIGIKDFEVEPLDKLLGDDDAVPDVKPTDIKLGDLFVLGDHRLLCGDSTDAAQVERLMNGEKANICFTSPPYNAGSLNIKGNERTKKKYNLFNDNQSENEYKNFLISNLNCILAVSNEALYNIGLVESNKRVIIDVLAHYKNKLKDIIYWKKNNVAPHIQDGVVNNLVEFILCFGDGKRKFQNAQFSQGSYYNVIEGSSAAGNEYSNIHKATFPIYLPENIINNFCPIKGTVLDTFGGTGTTLIAAEKTNRKCFMMELDPQYCQVIIDRWEQYTGKKAVKHG